MSCSLGCENVFVRWFVFFSVWYGGFLWILGGAAIGADILVYGGFLCECHVTAKTHPLVFLRIDRRVLIALVRELGAVAAILGILGWSSFLILLCTAFLIVGMSNPLYSLLIAHTNDFWD